MDSLERRSGQDRRSGEGAAMMNRRRDSGGDIMTRQGDAERGPAGATQLAPREAARWHRDTTADD